MRYPEYEDLLADSRPGTPTGSENFQQDLFDEDTDLEGLLNESHEQERERIETELQHIEAQLEDRKGIHEESVAELEEALCDEKDRLQRLQRPFASEGRVASQKRRIRELEQQLQDVQRTHWQDCEQLQRERRRLQRELVELRDTDLSAFF